MTTHQENRKARAELIPLENTMDPAVSALFNRIVIFQHAYSKVWSMPTGEERNIAFGDAMNKRNLCRSAFIQFFDQNKHVSLNVTLRDGYSLCIKSVSTLCGFINQTYLQYGSRQSVAFFQSFDLCAVTTLRHAARQDGKKQAVVD